MTEVFISHSLQDKSIAEQLRAYLEEKGVSCWTAPGNITPGSVWAGKQNAALSEMKVFVLVYSETGAASGQVARELELAQGREDVTVIPYGTDETPLSGSFERNLAGSKWIKADTERGDMKLDELYGRITAVIGVRKEDNVPAVKKQRLIRPSIAIFGCVFLLCFLACGAYSYYLKTRKADKTEKDSAYTENDPGMVTVEFLETPFVGDYSGDTDANGVPDGMGEFSGSYTNSNGTYTLKYSGGFNNGVFSGKGKSDVLYANGDNNIFEGEFVNGDYKGEGKQTYYYASGDFEKQVTTGIWDGDENVQNCVMTNYGRDGSVIEYRNDYKDDALNGKGTLTKTYPEGDKGNSVFECTWVNGKANGEGVLKYTYTEGDVKEKIFEGIWTDDILSGNITQTMIYFNGNVRVYEGEYSDD
ncbi:MAG: TIR domain-containing protein, partial [Clostridia bacterium]|nr:TIR domain-containing protein [Clostridia bacterium]